MYTSWQSAIDVKLTHRSMFLAIVLPISSKISSRPRPSMLGINDTYHIYDPVGNYCLDGVRDVEFPISHLLRLCGTWIFESSMSLCRCFLRGPRIWTATRWRWATVDHRLSVWRSLGAPKSVLGPANSNK